MVMLRVKTENNTTFLAKVTTMAKATIIEDYRSKRMLISIKSTTILDQNSMSIQHFLKIKCNVCDNFSGTVVVNIINYIYNKNY